MTITILCVGKIKERYLADAVSEYVKRLSRHAKVEIIEVRDEPTKEEPSEREREQIVTVEGERLLARMKKQDFVTALVIGGTKLDSEGFAGLLERQMNRGASRICFVIGGSLGLSREVQERAKLCLSFSDMTFPHQLMRVILLEQIYRGFKIIRHEPYHK